MLAARNQGFGIFNYTEPQVIETYTEYKSNPSSTSQTAFTGNVHTCRRDSKLVSWYKPNALTGDQFRDPCTYRRGVRSLEWTPGAWDRYWTGLAKTYERISGSPNTKASFDMLKIKPFFEGELINVDNNLRNQASTEALLKLKGQNDVQLGADLMEARRTANMLAGSYNSLATIALAAKRGQWSRIPKQFRHHFGGDGRKVPANLFLQIKYGWLPLMGTIFDLVELAKEACHKDLVLSARRHIRDNTSFDKKAIYPGWETSATASRDHSCTLYASISDPIAYRANQLGVINPLSVAWEVTRLSFVVDWLVPIGNFLDAISATIGTSFVGGYYGTWGHGNSHARLLPTTGWNEVSERAVSAEYFSYRRDKIYSFPTPLPYIKSPFTTGNILSAVALTHQLKR